MGSTENQSRTPIISQLETEADVATQTYIVTKLTFKQSSGVLGYKEISREDIIMYLNDPATFNQMLDMVVNTFRTMRENHRLPSGDVNQIMDFTVAYNILVTMRETGRWDFEHGNCQSWNPYLLNDVVRPICHDCQIQAFRTSFRRRAIIDSIIVYGSLAYLVLKTGGVM